MSSLLVSISSALLAPVLLALLALLCWTFLEAGGLLWEWRDRRSWERARPGAIHAILSKTSTKPLDELFALTILPPLLAAFAGQGRQLKGSSLAIGKIIADLELDALRQISRTQWGSRVAPMLGLMGTLIPLAAGLAGLSASNLPLLIDKLVVAFATTVVGIFIGGLCFSIATIRRWWYDRDLSDMSFIHCSLHPETA